MFTFSDMAGRWATEKDNAEWTANARDVVGAILAAADGGKAASFAIACKETLCRLQANSQDMTSLMRLAREAKDARASFRYARVPSDGGFNLMVFMWRTSVTREAEPVAAP
ncbi:MAG TPA: hypothetical protein VH062_03405 [Polyangiaceae bacterium]|nr:hypothetical protein [Polyangiaceae bacterium]